MTLVTRFFDDGKADVRMVIGKSTIAYEETPKCDIYADEYFDIDAWFREVRYVPITEQRQVQRELERGKIVDISKWI